MNLQKIIDKLLTLKGVIAAAAVDYESGMLMASGNIDPKFDLEIVAARSSEVMRAKIKTMNLLHMDDQIHDIMITTTTQYHFLCPVQKQPHMFLYLAMDRAAANVSRCRQTLFAMESLIE